MMHRGAQRCGTATHTGDDQNIRPQYRAPQRTSAQLDRGAQTTTPRPLSARQCSTYSPPLTTTTVHRRQPTAEYTVPPTTIATTPRAHRRGKGTSPPSPSNEECSRWNICVAHTGGDPGTRRPSCPPSAAEGIACVQSTLTPPSVCIGRPSHDHTGRPRRSEVHSRTAAHAHTRRPRRRAAHAHTGHKKGHGTAHPHGATKTHGDAQTHGVTKKHGGSQPTCV